MSERINLAEIEARCEAAQPGPWDWQVADDSMLWLHGPDDLRDVVLTCCRCESCQKSPKQMCGWPEKNDGDFIAHARTDLPPLVAWVREAREAITIARGDRYADLRAQGYEGAKDARVSRYDALLSRLEPGSGTTMNKGAGQ